MKTLHPALTAHLSSRGNLAPRVLVWFEAVAAVGGAAAPWGVWTGEDDRTFTIDGQPRTYFGAGAMGQPPDISFEAGYVVRLFRLPLSHLHPDVSAALASTILRLRPVDVHLAHLQPGTEDLVADPLRLLRGKVETMSEPRLAQGAKGMTDVQIASSARDLTRALDVTKSDATLRAVWPTDGFRKYNALSGKVRVAWGEA